MSIVVVGAGILGASTAWHLARAGAAVAIVDPALEGRATAAGAGIISPWASRSAVDPDWYRIAIAAARFYPALVRDLGGAPEQMSYARVGALSVSTNAADLDALAAAISARAAEAPEVGEVRRLRPAAARALFPPLHPDMAAVLATGGARVDGRRLAAALCDGAQRAGATVVSAPATLVARGGRIAGVRAGDRDIAADAVVVAAGAWAPALLAPLGVRLDVAPQRGQITHLRLPGVDTARWPVVSPPTSHYLVAFDDSRVVVGATRESGSGFDHRVTAAGQAEVLNAALAVAPGLAAATVIETRIGFRPLKPDNRPVLAAVPGLPGLLVGNGLGANGLTIGPFAGRLLADLALGRRPELDLAPYALPA